MTIIIGFSFPELSVLGADGRAISTHPLEPIDDDYPKIARTGFGVIAGAGRSDIVDPVTLALARNPPASNHDAGDMIRNDVRRLGLTSDHPAVQLSCWLATYTTGSAADLRAGMAFIHGAHNYNPQTIPHNSFYIIPPSGMSDDLEKAINDKTQSLLEKLILPAAPPERLSRCIAVIHQIIQFVSARNVTVGPRYSVAFHDTTPATGISNVLDDPRTLIWH